jgi:hypothetical protein
MGYDVYCPVSIKVLYKYKNKIEMIKINHGDLNIYNRDEQTDEQRIDEYYDEYGFNPYETYKSANKKFLEINLRKILYTGFVEKYIRINDENHKKYIYEKFISNFKNIYKLSYDGKNPILTLNKNIIDIQCNPYELSSFVNKDSEKYRNIYENEDEELYVENKTECYNNNIEPNHVEEFKKNISSMLDDINVENLNITFNYDYDLMEEQELNKFLKNLRNYLDESCYDMVYLPKKVKKAFEILENFVENNIDE